MNIAPFVAYQMTARHGRRRGYRNAQPDPFCTVMAILVMALFLILLVVLITCLFAEYEIVDTTVMTVTALEKDVAPKYDEYFVTLSNGVTYEVRAYTYSNLAVGDEVEVTNIIQHTWLGDAAGVRIAGEQIMGQ